MGGTTVRRITLSGGLRGSAVLTESEGKTAVTLSVRGLSDGMKLFTYGEGALMETAVKGTKLTLPQAGICAAVLTANGRIVSGGFNGVCAESRKRITGEVMIRAAEQNEETGKQIPSSAPASSVTEDILERARRLFPREEAPAVNGETAKPSENAAKMREVPNPFPRTFPGSVWKKAENDHRLFGAALVNGVTKSYIAVPVGRGSFGARTVTGKDGRRYLVERID